MTRDAGYSGKPLWRKLGLTPRLRCAVIDPPRDYDALTGFDPDQLRWPGIGAEVDFLHLFVRQRDALDPLLDAWLEQITPGGMLWVSWPKKSSSLFRDLTEDGIRSCVLPRGWVDVKVCAIDADWSGLKMLRRRK